MSDAEKIKPGLYDPAQFVPRQPIATPAPASRETGAAPAALEPVVMPPPSPWRLRFAVLLATSIVFFAGMQLYGFVLAAAALAPGLGWVALGLGGATLLAGGLWARHEIREFRRIARVEALQEEGERLLAEDQAGASQGWFAAVMRQLADVPAAAPGVARFQAMSVDAYAAGDALRLFEREVLADLDRNALAAVSRAVRDGAVGTAASPLAALDALIVFVRSLRMIREIAAAYGFRPGGLTSLAVLRRVLTNATTVAGADIVAELTADVVGGLGHKLAGTLSARLGVGVFAGMRMARLGIATMRACRPLPFLAEKPQIAQILRRSIGWHGEAG
jgi:putative membrane protein